jgi:diaminohydroxyphosphoribosylaminopyrimidine deaminase / 5-amino-6-(5-phosphoribosylamino)uracil reductase
MHPEERYMKRCLDLAILGKGNVAPNPMVGCVLVYNEHIVAEGWHQFYGGKHAEVNAIENLKDKSILSGCTLYVNLEPCSHYGKTPPCAKLIFESGIKKVVIGMQDPHKKVAGKGIAYLAERGVDIQMNVLQKKCLELNKRFITFHQNQRPYVVLKWAQSQDGYISLPQQQTTITDAIVQVLVHKWRSEEQAILIGTNTAYGGKNPLRLVWDKEGKLPPTLNLFTDGLPTMVITSLKKYPVKNVDTIYVPAHQFTWENVLNNLYARNIVSILVEGGAITHNHILQSEAWDEARVFTTDLRIKDGIKAPQVGGSLIEKTNIGNTQLTIYKP